MKAMCIDATGPMDIYLVDGKFYEVVKRKNDTKFYDVIYNPNRPPMVMSVDRFHVLDDNAPITQRSSDSVLDTDKEETEIRNRFTRPVADKYTCSKCSAPMPCSYHS